MAVEDVICATRERLAPLIAPIGGQAPPGGGRGAEPPVIGGGAGADLSYDEQFEKVKAEIEKLTSMSGGRVDWKAIAADSEELLRDKGKDLRVAVYYAAARTKRDGLEGLFDGLFVVSELIANFWTTMGPPLQRPRARGNLFPWFSELCAPFIEPFVASYERTVEDKDLIRALDQVLRGVDRELVDKLGDADAYGGMHALRNHLYNLVRCID